MGIILGLLNTVIVLLSLFLIGVILIQRGKGGGLAGAFGGAGGSSAFGTKAGDVFTRITGVAAIIWIALAMLLVVITNQHKGSAFDSETSSTVSKSSTEKNKSKAAAGSKATDAKATGSKAAPSTPDAGLPTDIPAIPDIPAPK